MSENTNFCPECGTENESKYPYCKNCGTGLLAEVKNEPSEQPHVTDTPPVITQPPIQKDSNNYSGGYYGATGSDYACIDGIPLEEIQIFIGKKSNEIMPKFINMEITRSKNSWCWPPAILGFFFGPLGAALWFFYRKMYKHAFILAAIGAVIELIVAFLTINTTNTYTDAILDAFASGNFAEIMTELENIMPSVRDTVASLIQNISTIATSVVVGIFGCYRYKEHCISKIKEFRNMNPDNNYYRLGLMSLGGTSGGMLALGILLMLGVDYVITFVTTMITVLM